jgi:hypothetical protein
LEGKYETIADWKALLALNLGEFQNYKRLNEEKLKAYDAILEM